MKWRRRENNFEIRQELGHLSSVFNLRVQLMLFFNVAGQYMIDWIWVFWKAPNCVKKFFYRLT